jgi:hypothetical protein
MVNGAAVARGEGKWTENAVQMLKNALELTLTFSVFLFFFGFFTRDNWRSLRGFEMVLVWSRRLWF